MNTVSQPIAISSESSPKRHLADLGVLLKPRVTTLIVISAWCGFYFAAHKSGLRAVDSLHLLAFALVGVGLVAGGTAALNQVLERDSDAHMYRTAVRPLPAHRLEPREALLFGLAGLFAGLLLLAMKTNLLTAALSLATSVSYLGLYTPLKKISPWCTFVGAFPGAMPPVLGWAALRGRLEWETLVLFAILFLWQFPHFFSIAWLYSEDYESAGIRMLPVVEKDGRSTVRQSIVYGALLIPVSLLPFALHMTGIVYLCAAIVLGGAYLFFATKLGAGAQPPAAPQSKKGARQLLRASVLYLPLLFLVMMLNAA
ncbi:MAG: heme o synthase [Terriglobales bacterium]